MCDRLIYMQCLRQFAARFHLCIHAAVRLLVRHNPPGDGRVQHAHGPSHVISQRDRDRSESIVCPIISSSVEWLCRSHARAATCTRAACRQPSRQVASQPASRPGDRQESISVVDRQVCRYTHRCEHSTVRGRETGREREGKRQAVCVVLVRHGTHLYKQARMYHSFRDRSIESELYCTYVCM